MSLGKEPNTQYLTQAFDIVNGTINSVTENLETLNNLDVKGDLLVGDGAGPSYLSLPPFTPLFSPFSPLFEEFAEYSVLTIDDTISPNNITWKKPPVPPNNTNINSSLSTLSLTAGDSDKLVYFERNAGNINLPTTPTNGTNYEINCIGSISPKSAEVATVVDLSTNASTIVANYDFTGGPTANGAILVILIIPFVFVVDGVTLTAADNGKDILVKSQTNAYENGLYTINAIVGITVTLNRALNFASSTTVKSGDNISIRTGSVNNNTNWIITNPDPISPIGGQNNPGPNTNGELLTFVLNTPATVPNFTVELATTTDLDSNASISGTITYTATGGASTRGQITATLAVSDTFDVDGVTLSATENGTRILLKDQTSADQNGIWTTTVSGTSLTLDRSTDYDADGEAVSGDNVFITSGTVNYSLIYTLTNTATITLGGSSGSDLNFANIHLIKTNVVPTGGDTILAVNNVFTSSLWATKDTRFDIIYDATNGQWIVFPMNGPLLGS